MPRPATDGNEAYAVTGLPNGDLLVFGKGFNWGNLSGNNQQLSSYHFLVRTDSLGAVRWRRQYNLGVAYMGQYQPAPLVLPNGDILIAAAINPPPGTQFAPVPRVTVMRLDSTGALRWRRAYGQQYGTVQQFVPTPDGSYALAGNQQYVQGQPGQQYLNSDAWLLRLTADGDSVRSTHWGQPTASEAWNSVRVLPSDGLLLTGVVGGVTGGIPSIGWMAQVDTLDQVQWQHYGTTTNTTGCRFDRAEVFANGEFLLNGNWGASSAYTGYLGRWQPPTGAGSLPTELWQQPIVKYSGRSQHFLSADGHLTIIGALRPVSGGERPILAHYEVGAPYAPAFCRRPPVLNAAAQPTSPAADSLVFFDFSTAGPRYGTLVRWRWELGDGTVVVRDDAQPFGHRYTPRPPTGTAVRLSVTNNLGCTSTQLLYPWGGGPTAMQAAAAGLAAGCQLYPNPAGGGTTMLRLPGLRPQPPVPAELLDALGRVVRQLALPVVGGTVQQQVDLRPLPAGVYCLRLHPQEGAFSKRLVVQ